MNETEDIRRSTSERNFEHLREQAVELGVAGSPSSLLLALSKDGVEWRLAYGELVLGLETKDDIDWNWSNFRLVHKTIDQEDALELLERLFSEGSLAISKSESIGVSGELRNGIRRRSASKRHGADWPVRIYGYHLDNTCRGALHRDDLFGHGLPYYPDARVAIAHRAIWLSEHFEFPQGSLQIFLIDRRARFSKVKVNAKNIVMEVDWGHLSPARATVKAYVEPSKQDAYNADIKQENGVYSLFVGGLPHSFYVAIVTDTGDKVDWRTFLSYSDWGREGVEIDIATEELRLMLLRGENVSLEFKEGTKSKPGTKEKMWDILETIVAFANKQGGFILLGVDDNGGVIGSEEKPQDIREKFQNWNKQYVDPPVEFEAHFVAEEKVHVIRINESTSKPCNLRDRGFYIRANSTDRHMTKTEMDEMKAK